MYLYIMTCSNYVSCMKTFVMMINACSLDGYAHVSDQQSDGSGDVPNVEMLTWIWDVRSQWWKIKRTGAGAGVDTDRLACIFS